MKPSHAVIIGLGYVGSRVAREELAAGNTVSALVRSVESSTRANLLSIYPYPGDLDHIESLATLPLRNATVYYLAPPPGQGIRDTRLANFLTAITATPPAALVYISTTGVYGNTTGAWVTESTPLNPQQDRSRRRQDAESQLAAWAKHQITCRIAILRVGGIYGPGKLPLTRLQKREPMVDDPANPSWVNVIHVDDLVTICGAAARHPSPFEIYNVSDGHPLSMMAYFRTIAILAGLAPPPAISLAEGKKLLSPEMYSYVTESRRVDTRKLREKLAPKLRYTILSEGVCAALREKS